MDSVKWKGKSCSRRSCGVRSGGIAFPSARTNVTAGEVEALHANVNRVQAENAELQARLATVERLLEQLQKERS